MNAIVAPGSERLERELSYYRRECNDLGARLLRLQEEQSQAFREARRSRTTAKLVREAYRLADGVATAEEIGGSLLEVIIANAMCDRAAFLAESEPGSGRFSVTHLVGLSGEGEAISLFIPNAPGFFFTTSQTRIEPPAYELMGILQLPYVLWSYDRFSGKALIVGNRSESNVSRAFEAGDQELIEGALSVYIDVLTRKQAELQVVRARKAAEETVAATAEFLGMVSGALRMPLNSIIGCSEKMGSGSRHPLTIETCVEFADRINESGVKLVGLFNDILDYSSFAKGRLSLAPDWHGLAHLLEPVQTRALSASDAGRIEIRLANHNVELHVDLSSFRQALDQLVARAVRISAAAMPVSMTAQLRSDGWLDLGISSRGHAGHAPSDHALSLYGPALPMARAMVESHDGTLSIETSDDRTDVGMRFPAHRVRVAARAAR
jgi:signal transduction histidine kinase